MNDFELNEKAKKLMDKGKYKEALKLLEKIKDEDMLYKKLVNSGICYRNLKEYDKALEKYEEAIKNDPKMYKTYSNLGNIYSDLEEYDKALEYYIKAVELSGYEIVTSYNLISEYKRRKEYDKIVEIIPKINFEKQEGTSERLYRLAKEYIYVVIGETYYEKEDYKNAIEYFEKVEKKSDNECNYLAVNYNRLGDYKNAVKYNILSIFKKPEKMYFTNMKKILTRMVKEWSKH